MKIITRISEIKVKNAHFLTLFELKKKKNYKLYFYISKVNELKI